jgi:cation:H+ antiporter
VAPVAAPRKACTMEILDLLSLFGGLVLLVKGGDLFVAAAVRIARFLRLPTVVIGSTIVSLATTVPEFVVAVMSGARGTPALAVGNTVGTCVCNIALILGVAATIKRVEILPGVLHTALTTMVALGAGLYVMTFDQTLARWEGVILIMAGAGYFAYSFIEAGQRERPVEVAEAKAIERTVTKSLAWFETRHGTVAQFTLAAGIVFVSSRLVVDGAIGIATALGVSPLIVGLTVVAIGTSLPELVTAVGSARRGVADLAVGNIIGANIANLSFVLGIAAVLTPVSIEPVTQRFDFPVMLVAMSVLVWRLWTQHRLTRRDGIIMLVSYAGYIAMVITLAWCSHPPPSGVIA